ncbi:hypothetical protein EWW49_32245, partial [Pseudomonas syringae]
MLDAGDGAGGGRNRPAERGQTARASTRGSGARRDGGGGDATLTAVGSLHGSLAPGAAVDLGAAGIRQRLARAGVDGAQVDEVIRGQVLTAGAGQ